MAFDTPSLKAMAERVRGAFRANLPGTDAWIWPNNVYASAKVIAAATWEVLLRLRWVVDQAFVTTAEGSFLDRHGADYGLPRLPATYAEGTGRFSGAVGSAVAAGLIVSNGAGRRFRVQSGASIPQSGSVDVPLRAIDEGAASNTHEGATLTINGSPIGIDENATTPSGIGGGSDEENDERYRERLLFRKQNPPHGGAPSDYVLWARQIAGVTRVWPVRAAFGPGTIAVYFLMDDLYENGIPLNTDVIRVSDHIDGLAPAGAVYSVFAPAAYVVDVKIAGLTPDNGAVRDAVVSEIAETFRREARPTTPGAYGTTEIFSPSWIWQAAANASGERRHRIISPVTDIVVPIGKIAVLGSVDFD